MARQPQWALGCSTRERLPPAPPPPLLAAAHLPHPTNVFSRAQALRSSFERSRASALTITAMLGALSVSAAYKKVLKESRQGFERLPLFVMLIFLHDALHAGLNSGKRSFARAFTYAKAIDLEHKSGVEKCISKKLTAAFVYNGLPTNAAGQYIKGPHVAFVPKQFRGAQFIDAISARVWECFEAVGRHDVRDAFESIIGNTYGLHFALRLGRKEAALRFYGKPPDEEARKTNEEKAVLFVKQMWDDVRTGMCRLFPGDCNANFNAVFATNGWMMRSYHTLGHLAEDFELGRASFEPLAEPPTLTPTLTAHLSRPHLKSTRPPHPHPHRLSLPGGRPWTPARSRSSRACCASCCTRRRRAHS